MIRHPDYLYRFLDYRLSSTVRLPALSTGPATGDDLLLHEAAACDEGFHDVHHWQDDTEDPVNMICARSDNRYRLTFPDALTAWLDPAARSVGFETATDPATTAHLLRDQVLPRLVAGTGEVVLHAAGVALTHGVVALVGASGAGKSTTAAGCYLAGHGIISDDCLLVRVGQGGVNVTGSYAGLRLNADVAERLLPAEQVDLLNDDAGKRRLSIDDNAAPVSRALAAVVFLEEARRLTVRPLSGAEATMRLMSQTFSLDPTDTAQASGRLRQLSAVVASGLRIVELAYPRRFDCLAEVVDYIAAAGGELP